MENEVIYTIIFVLLWANNILHTVWIDGCKKEIRNLKSEIKNLKELINGK